MKLVIESGEIPKLYDNNGNQIKGIKECSYDYKTATSDSEGYNEGTIDFYGDNHNSSLFLNTFSWEKA